MTKLDEKWALTREMVGAGRLSIVLPLYNLADEVEKNLGETADLFERYGVRTELVPVDDGSGDETGARVRAFAEKFRSANDTVVIKPVICRRNGGKGAALRAGFDTSCGDYVMLLDGDLDIHPKQTPYFFEQMNLQRADIVVGSKRHPRSVVQYPWHRRLVSLAYFTMVRLAVGLKVTDTQTGMKLFKRQVLGEALGRMLVKTYAFDLELLSIANERGAKIAEAPVVIRFGSKFGCLKAKTVRAMAMDSLAVFYRLRVLHYYRHAEAPRRLDHEPMVSIVIACPHPSWMLTECVKAIRAQSWERWECLVLPDTDEGCRTAEGADDGRIRFLPTGKVRPAEKRNLGIREAKGEIVAFIDDDAFPDPHWLEYAVRYFSEPGIAAVGGPAVTPPGDSYLARVGGRVYDNWLVSGNYRYRYKVGGVRMDVDDYPSCNLFVRKAALEMIGGYRTDFWPGEDTLLCKDIIDGGKRIVYDPWVVVYHHRRPLLSAHLRQLGRYAFHRGYFCKRYPSNSLRFSYFVPSLFLAYLLVATPVTAWLAAGGRIEHPQTMAGLLLLLPPAVYLALALVTTAAFNPLTWLLAFVGVILSHATYGIRFLQGLCARKAPCEFIGKDHAQGKTTA